MHHSREGLIEWITTPHQVFLFLALLFGGLFLIITPPFQEPDGYVHFLRIYSISAGKAVPVGVTVPRSLLDFFEQVNPDPLPGNFVNKQSKRALLAQFFVPFDDLTPVPMDLTDTIEYTHVAYTPQVIGVSAGRMLHLPAIYLFYLARLCNFSVWVVGCYWAIRKTPVFKWVFLLLALMPMTVFQGASISPDALLIAGSFLFLAFCLRLAIHPGAKVDVGPIAGLAALLVLIACLKPGYSLIWLFAWAIPTAKFGSLRRKIGVLALWLGAALLPMLWWQMTTSGIGVWSGEENHQISENLAYILGSPDVFLSRLVENYLVVFPWTKKMFIGVLGWLDTPLPEYAYLLFTTALLLVPLLDNRAGFRIPIGMRILGPLLYFGVTFSLMVVFFISQNSPDATRFHAVQGRYFLPFAPAYFLFLYQRKLLVPSKWMWPVALFSALGLGIALRALLFRYYAI